MCGRFLLTSPPEAVATMFNVDVRDNFPPRYNIAPTQPIAVIRQNEQNAREYALVRWGFIPSWAKKVEGRPLINARGETIAEKPSFRSAFKRRRCIIPCDGFYEWKTINRIKRPFCIHPKDKSIFGFAAIWETATDPDGGEIDTAAIVTIDVGDDLQHLHHREPVIIAKGDIDLWLGADERDLDLMSPMIRPASMGFWHTYEVATSVNSVRNDGPDLIHPVSTGRLL